MFVQGQPHASFVFCVIKVVNKLSCLLIARAWFEKRHVYVCLLNKQVNLKLMFKLDY